MRMLLKLGYLSSCFLAGCGSGTAGSNYTLPLFSGGAPAFAYDHAYGDSISFGFTLQDPATQAFPALVAKSTGLPLTTYAISGDQACDVPTRQIFPGADAPTLAHAGLYTLLIGTNDLDTKGAGTYETDFNLCHQASIAWLALPAEDKVLATSTVVTTSGSVVLESANHWNALTTNGLGASITIPFSRTAAGAVYLWYRIHDGSTGSFVYRLDGAPLGLVSTGTDPAMRTANGTTDSLALLRIPLVAPGQHTLQIQQTNAGPTAVGIVALGLPPAAGQTDLPLVLVGTTPRQLVGAGGPCSVESASCQAYIRDIEANVSLLASDGLNVRVFDSRKYLQGTSSEMNDVVHPNALGQLELAHSVLDVLNPTPVR